LTDEKRDPQAKGRATIGRALGQLQLSDGTLLDNRRGIGVLPNGLPDIEWVEIPAGEFAFEFEDEQHRLELPTFCIARYPVTYVQFQSFLDAEDGFTNPEWWKVFGKTSESWLGEQRFKFSNHPRENVSWGEAVAFCQWLSAKLGYEVTLPTEFQWVKAARGASEWRYPYEGQFDANKGNTNETGIEQTSAVGIFPHGASPYGILDMAGNVCEWCLNGQYNLENTDLTSREPHALRGGSWNLDRGYANCIRSFDYDAYDLSSRTSFFGFRVIASYRCGDTLIDA
jgi:formylglycine-generating enzyme required for sulfatase activity